MDDGQNNTKELQNNEDSSSAASFCVNMMCLLRRYSYRFSGLQNNSRGNKGNQAWLPSVREQPSIMRIPFMVSR